jgi:hypothetical protein
LRNAATGSLGETGDKMATSPATPSTVPICRPMSKIPLPVPNRAGPVPATVAHRFRGAAGARGFTHAQYLSALVSLHEAMRKRADDGDAEVKAALGELGLGTVSI